MNELTPEQISAKLDQLYIDYEKCCGMLSDIEESYMNLYHDTLEAINAREDGELCRSTQLALENITTKLTIADKDTMIRAENPKLYDRYHRIVNAM